MTPFLDLATHEISPAARDKIVSDFLPKLEAVCDSVEFDLTLWSLAQRLGVDTEELLRQIGARWLRQSGLFKESLVEGEKNGPSKALVLLFSRFGSGNETPLPGTNELSIEVTTALENRVKVACGGARRCCSFLEGMARALCQELGVTLRYIRQPKRATYVLISFNLLVN